MNGRVRRSGACVGAGRATSPSDIVLCWLRPEWSSDGVAVPQFCDRMWVMLLVIVCGAAVGIQTSWVCPDIFNVSCSCDYPHTLRCNGKPNSLDTIAGVLKNLPESKMVSLLDCSIQGLVHIDGPILKDVSLYGLVISSGALVSVAENTFDELRSPLEALGLPNNQLRYVPILALSKLNRLTRLDLSHNRLQTLGAHSFQSLYAVRFLDLSSNRLINISSNAFTDMSRLKTLRLQSNSLDSDVISRLQGLLNLEECDLSSNRISGPLTPRSFARLPRLLSLNIAHNQISSILSRALTGFDSIESLNLENNMIDVLEDQAFKAITTLKVLNLSHNRIIAFSESSFAHLKNLSFLDLSNNFLRALSTDLIAPLVNLRKLHLDDNDISMISAEALKNATNLELLTLADNPLNCDCSLLGFAEWLNSTTEEQKEKSEAVCAIPPFLENAFVRELGPQQLVCEQDDLSTGPIPVSGTRVMLQGFDYNGTHISLLWMVDAQVPYRCGELFIYEELGAHEVLLETESLDCNSSTVTNTHFLSMTHDVSRMEKGHKYRYCITMVELRQKTTYDTSNSLALGCSEIMALQEVYRPRIAALQAINSALGYLDIYAEAWPPSAICLGSISVHMDSKLVHKSSFHCELSNYNISDLPPYGRYNVCVWLTDNSDVHCVSVPAQYILPHPYIPFVTLISSVMFFVLLLVAVMIYKYINRKPRQPKLQEQCFHHSDRDESLNSGYMKLHATTRL